MKSKKPEGDRLFDETPGHLRLSESKDKSSSDSEDKPSSAFEDKPSSAFEERPSDTFDHHFGSDLEDKEDEDTPPVPSISAPGLDPSSSSSSSTKPQPPTSAFMTTLGVGKGKATAGKPTAKALGMSDDDFKAFLSLGADPYLPRGLIESFLRVFKHFALKTPRGKV